MTSDANIEIRRYMMPVHVSMVSEMITEWLEALIECQRGMSNVGDGRAV